MPGVLTMEGRGTNGSEAEARAGGLGNGVSAKAALPAEGKVCARAGASQLPPQIDGPAEARNGVSVSDTSIGRESTLPTGNVALTPSLAHSSTSLLPELQHITEGYQQLGKLAERLAQECFVGIIDLVNELTEIENLQQTSHAGATMVNGNAHVNGVEGSVSASVLKRERIIVWANDHREKFIKLLVLTQWCKQVEFVGKIIDLNAWAREQKSLYEQIAWDLGMLKRNLHGAKLPNPDIRTALEVLSTGKASWMPDLGYIPPEPLTARKMLRALRDINALLSIRLNLHEIIPSHFKDFTIANGRATFLVPSEFEVDLSIADEDPTSQFFFIDFRLSFSPTSEIPTGQLRFHLEERANYVLSTEGLAGCYEFLHNFVLTHKINILRKQAIEMSRHLWTQTIRVEPVHRSLVVQYWLDRPGSKSWVEIGIAASKRKHGGTTEKVLGAPYLAIKWVRGGKEVTGVKIPFNVMDLSMDLILKDVVALHTLHIFGSIRNKLAQVPIYASGKRLLVLDNSPGSPNGGADAAVLRFQGLGDDESVYKLSVEQYTGHITLEPAIGATRIENEINRLRDPAVDAHTRLLGFLYGVRQSKIEQIAEHSGWRLLRTLNSRIQWDAVKASFGQDVARCSYFQKGTWSKSNWTIAVTISPGGESWWILETFATEPGIGIRHARAIPTRDNNGLSPSVSQSLLAKVEQLATIMISLLVASLELKELRVPHVCQQTMAVQPSASSATFALPALFIKFSALMRLRNAHMAWSYEWLRLSHDGFWSSGEAHGQPKLTQLVTGIMKKPLDVQNTLVRDRYDDADVSFLPSGAFTLAFRLALGTQWIQQLIARLKGIERLQVILGTLKRKGFQAESSSLSHVVFAYAEDLKVEFLFIVGTSARIKFIPATNPHRRIATHLAALVKEQPHDRAFSTFADALITTLPLLQAFDRLECSAASQPHPSTASPTAPSTPPAYSFHATLHPRSWKLYRIRFPTCAFDVELRRRRGSGQEWHITESTSSLSSRTGQVQPATGTPQELVQRLCELVMEKGNGWKGLRGSRPAWAASIDGVKELVARLNDVVSAFGTPDPRDGNGNRVKGETEAG